MAHITLSVTEELKAELEQFKEINWSEVTRVALSERVKRLRLLNVLDKLIGQGASDEEALAIAKRLKESPDDEELQKALFLAIGKKSRMSEEEAENLALELGRKVNKAMHKRLKKLYPELK